MKKFFLVFLLIIGFNSNINAETNICSSSGCISKIEVFYVISSGKLYIGTPLDEKLANCTPVSGVYFTLSQTSTSEMIFSTLLSAYMSNSTVQLRIKEGSDNCEISYVTLRKNF